MLTGVVCCPESRKTTGIKTKKQIVFKADQYSPSVTNKVETNWQSLLSFLYPNFFPCLTKADN